MIRFRKGHPALRKGSFFNGAAHSGKSLPDITWHGSKPGEPDWTTESHSIAMLINGAYAELIDGKADNDLYVIFNASGLDSIFEIPEAPSGKPWRIAIDTSKGSPEDIYASGEGPLLDKDRYSVARLSTVVLVSK
jgi:isoamylase